METEDPWGLVGRCCTSVTRIVHQFSGDAAREGGPLEIAWDDGRYTVLWRRNPVTEGDQLADILGSQVISVQPWLNEIGELAGVDIEFDGRYLEVRQFSGDLTAQVSDRRASGGRLASGRRDSS